MGGVGGDRSWDGISETGKKRKPGQCVLGNRAPRLRLTGDPYGTCFRETRAQGGVREPGVYSLAPLGPWLRAARGRQDAASAGSWLQHRGRCWQLAGGVAGALTASAALTEPGPGSPACPLERVSCQALFLQLPSLHAHEAGSPSCPGWTLPPGASHQRRIHCVQQMLTELLLCAHGR